MTTRYDIRYRLRDLLRGEAGGPDWPTAAGKRVYPSRTVPVMIKHLPAILIFVASDKPDPMAGWIERRDMTVAIRVIAAGDDADDQVDALTAQVEDILDAYPTLGDIVQSTAWGATTLDLDGEGDEPVVVADMELLVTYFKLPPEEPSPPVPTEVLGSWAPEIGPPHEDKYTPIAAGDWINGTGSDQP